MARYRYEITVKYLVEADSPDEAFRLWVLPTKEREQYLLFESLAVRPSQKQGWMGEWEELDDENS
jgi:hypothetical protein